MYIDESGFKSKSTSLHSYSAKRSRAKGILNWQLKNCSNAIGALIENRLLTVGVFKCSVNTEVFECWSEQDLLPKLKETSVLILDFFNWNRAHMNHCLIKFFIRVIKTAILFTVLGKLYIYSRLKNPAIN